MGKREEGGKKGGVRERNEKERSSSYFFRTTIIINFSNDFIQRLDSTPGWVLALLVTDPGLIPSINFDPEL